MKLKVAWIGKTKEPAIQALTDEYLKRLRRYVDVEGLALRDEAALVKSFGIATRGAGRPTLVILDARGKQLSSEELARYVGDHQDRNPLPLAFAVGPANGFSEEARRSAAMTLSLGKMTLPHELARIVLLEQLYRAYSILNRHPYHLGH